jgi:hypothetical protein
MIDNKASGVFHRITRVSGGLYGVETVVLEKGKIVSTSEVSPNYPTVTLAKFGKQAFAEAHAEFDRASEQLSKEQNA